jgi:adenylate cyclase
LEPAETRRHLAAILAADVAGYSRLMGADEEGTLTRLKDHRSKIWDPALARHRGRIANTAGDSILAEFSSVQDAVNCALVVQKGMLERNSDVESERRIEFRIGINLGEVLNRRSRYFRRRRQRRGPAGGNCRAWRHMHFTTSAGSDRGQA